ncbi:MAG TPA: hypothetical protein VHG93_03655 [Longimicrobium sp.]|nr:hypothetical protein [Longimicrobium sp.]
MREDGRGSSVVVRRGRGERAPSREADRRGAEERTAYPWWLLSLAAVGAVAAGGTALTLFSSLGRHPARTWAADAPDVGSQAFLLGISGIINAPLAKGGSARLLKNEAEIFPAILGALREGGPPRRLRVSRPGTARNLLRRADCVESLRAYQHRST